MANIYEQQDLPEECLEALEDYQRYALLANDTLSYIVGLERKVGPYYLLDDSLQVFCLTDSTRKLYLDRGLNDYASRACATAIYVSLNSHNWPSARRYMDFYEQDSKLFNEQGEINSGQELYYDVMGQYYMGIGNEESAEYNFRKVIAEGYPYEGYKGLLSVYLSHKNIDSIAKYAVLHDQTLLQWKDSSQAETIIQSSAMYRYERNQNLVMKKDLEAKRNRNIIFYILILSSFTTIYFHQKHKTYKQAKTRELQDLDRQYTATLQEYERQHEEFLYLQINYETLQQTSFNNQNRIRKEAGNQLAQKQRQIESLQQSIAGFKERLKTMNASETYQLFMQNETIKQFKRMANPIRTYHAMTEKDWEKLIEVYQTYAPQIHTRLLSLSYQERLTCMLIHMRFTSTEIALLLGTTVQRISNIKKSANEKLFHDKSASTLLRNMQTIQ